ncbi:uncharacterized protein LOC124693103 [Lolium rigidum]|uniref:uncharacterized protein LOC124693103 n=1 Tax=Lolium rigidum TaxID=89674 RepID=UPI001F5CC706|nr:uncharacterized protein LOC124693103 [Lolium rigidum]
MHLYPILYSEYSLVGRTAGGGWFWCNIKWLTAGNMDATEDWKMQYNGRYWSSRPHQRQRHPMAVAPWLLPNGSGALALTGDCSSSAFVPDISSLDKSLQHCFLVD